MRLFDINRINAEKLTDSINIFGITNWGLAVASALGITEHNLLFLDNNEKYKDDIIFKGIKCSTPCAKTKENSTIICVHDYKNRVDIESQLNELGYIDILYVDESINEYLSEMDDRAYIEIIWYIEMGYEIDIDNVKTFNERLQWLKLYDRKSIYTTMVDKYVVKGIVSAKIGEEHIVPLLGVWDKAEEIDFDGLPDQFVLKCNHNSGSGMYICKDKSKLTEADYERIRNNLTNGLSQNYYILNREWPYKDVKRKIICERYMSDDSVNIYVGELNSDGLIDYKFYCFNGEPKFLYVGFANIIDGRKRDMLTYMTLDWEKPPFYRDDHPELPRIPRKPKELDKMIEYASILSKGIPFVRVDFFAINSVIYFSEFTFTPGAGFNKFKPESWEIKLGDLIKLPAYNL